MSQQPPILCMQQVHRYLHTLVQADRYGGRIIVRDADTLLLYDVSAWGDAQAEAVRRRFPSCGILCLASSTSLSGFVVVIHQKRDPTITLWTTALGLTCVAVCMAMWHLLLS